MAYRKKDEDGFNTDFLRKQARKGAAKKTFQQKTSGFGGTTKPKLRVSAPTTTPNVARSYANGLKKLKKRKAMESIKATPKRMSTRTLARNQQPASTLKTAVQKRDYAKPENTVGLRTRGKAVSRMKNKWDRY